MGVWDRVQRAHADHGGLADVFSLPRPHLHRVYWLCDDKCWQIVCALLFCQTEVKVHDCNLRFRAIARISLSLLLNLCWAYIFFGCVTTKQMIQWITGNYNFRPKAPEKSDKFLVLPTVLSCGFQLFHVAYVLIKFANSPRPDLWVLERSVDNGRTFTPWQYFAREFSCSAIMQNCGFF